MPPRILDLFSGTHSVSKAVLERYADAQVVSLDNDPRHGATFVQDIFDFNYRSYEPGHFDYVHASPPCQQFSIARTTGPPRNLEQADAIVERTLEILRYLQPRYWTLENPQTGLLKTRPFMADIHFTDVDYCKYGFPYRKRTRIWTNLRDFQGNLCRYDCGSIIPGTRRHVASICNVPVPPQKKQSSAVKNSIIPPALVHAWLDCMDI